MITDAQLVEKYLALKAKVASMTEAFDAQVKPYKDGMAMIENALLALLNERGADNTKTENGTAYKSTLLNVKVVDQAAFLKFCTEQGGSVEMLNIGALKEPVKEWIEETGNPPPGVETSQFVRVNVRRS
jgi:hypothetical protein